MTWATKEFLETDGLDTWVYDFSKLISFSKKALIVREITGKIVQDEYLRLKPHDPKKWVSGKELRREPEPFSCFVSSLKEKY